MQLVDSHCHPHFSNFADKPTLLADAAAAGVGRLIAVGTTLADSRAAVEFAADHKNVWASAGVHPHEAEKFNRHKGADQELLEILNKSSIIAVGEIGLDFYKNFASKDDQIAALRSQIEATLASGLPYIFHIREAWSEFWEVFDSYPGIRGVVHSFTAHEHQLEQALGRGLYVGLNGIMTFTHDEHQLAAAKEVPVDRLLLETDAPFLAPKPYRGQICEPKHLAVTAEFLAHLRGEDLAELAAATTKNAINLFGLSDEK